VGQYLSSDEFKKQEGIDYLKYRNVVSLLQPKLIFIKIRYAKPAFVTLNTH